MSNPFDDWVSLFDGELQTKWESERPELKKLSMIYSAFQKEVDNMKEILNREMSELNTSLKRRDFLRKCQKFKGFAQSEAALTPTPPTSAESNKENAPPEQSYENEHFDSCRSQPDCDSPSIIYDSDTNTMLKSPVIKKGKTKREPPISSAQLYFTPTDKSETITPKIDAKLTKAYDMENDTSVIDSTPQPAPKPKRNLSLKRRNKSSQSRTLTQMYGETSKTRPVDKIRKLTVTDPSMGITEIMEILNTSDEESDDDKTVDDLGSEQQILENEVDEKQEMRGWSCKACEKYYELCNLSPKSLAEKMNICSKHKSRLKPPADTLKGLWDMTYKCTPDSQEPSLVFN